MRRMKTRMQKYARYRARILRTPDEKFENKKMRKVEVSKEEKKAVTPYTKYHTNQVIMYSVKGGLFVIAIVVFILLYCFWVKG